MAMDFIAGCVGGCAGVVVGHPLDTIKVHMQVGEAPRSGLACTRALLQQGGARALYRGVTSPMAGVAAVNAIVFGVYGGVRRRATDPDSMRAHALAGAAAGLAQAPICGPAELAKTRMQLGGGHTNPIACLRDIMRNEGPLALSRGLGLTALRDSPAFACYFTTYELLIKQADGQPVGTIRTLIAGGLAGMASWLVTFPVDAVKSRLQADGLTGTRMYSGAVDCLKKSVATEGYGFLSRGLGPVLLRAFPSNAACFGVVTWCLRQADENSSSIKQPKSPAIVCGPLYAAHAYRSLLFAGALNEVICAADIRDLHEDFTGLGPTAPGTPLKIGIVTEARVNS